MVRVYRCTPPMPVHAFLLARHLRLSETWRSICVIQNMAFTANNRGIQPVCRAPVMFGHHVAGRNFTGNIMFKDKILLITGGTGSFGNAVVRRFLHTDIGEIRIFSRDEKKQDDMRA